MVVTSRRASNRVCSTRCCSHSNHVSTKRVSVVLGRRLWNAFQLLLPISLHIWRAYELKVYARLNINICCSNSQYIARMHRVILFNKYICIRPFYYVRHTNERLKSSNESFKKRISTFLMMLYQVSIDEFTPFYMVCYSQTLRTAEFQIMGFVEG
jgi:hypothetical protein